MNFAHQKLLQQVHQLLIGPQEDAIFLYALVIF